MKTLSSRFATHVGEVSTSLCLCLKITRTDAAVRAFTTADQDVVIGAVTYKSTGGIAPTSIKWTAGVRADGLDIIGLYDASGVTEVDLQAGLYDGATVELRLVNWDDPSGGSLVLPGSGRVSTVEMGEGTFRMECLGNLALLSQRTIACFSPTCRVDLGGTECGVDLETGQLDASHLYKYTAAEVTGVTSNAVFTIDTLVTPEDGASELVGIDDDTTIGAEHNGLEEPILDYYWSNSTDFAAAGLRVGMTVTVAGFTDDTDNGNRIVTAVIDKGADYATTGRTRGQAHRYQLHVSGGDFAGKRRLNDEAPGNNVDITVDQEPSAYTASGWFSHGKIVWTSGNNSGLEMEVREYTSTGQTVKLVLPMRYAVQVGDQFTIYAGCDKRRGTCKVKFSNLVNFRGEPDLPGRDEYEKSASHADVEVS